MSIQYYPARLGESTFKLAKFSETAGDQPENVYYITWDKSKDEMQCSCPNRRRGKHIDDKHGQMIRTWLERQETVGFFDDKGAFHERQYIADNPFLDPELPDEQWPEEDGSDAGNDPLQGDEEH